MRLNFAYKPFYLETGIDEREYSQEVYVRLEKLKFYAELRQEGCREATTLKAVSCSRSTLFRWKKNYAKYGLSGLESCSRAPLKKRSAKWSLQDELLVFQIRKQFPLWGKEKIKLILQRDYANKLSVSTVGRIVTKLLKKKKVLPVSFYMGKAKPKKARSFDFHAKRIPPGLKAKKPGDLIQIDHATIIISRYPVKHFGAICPVTKVAFNKAYSTATSACAADFLDFIIAQFPFKITGIQVDGGSEFRGDFESACSVRAIPLWVLPPREPEMNGSIERCHKTPKYEFYPFYQGKLNIKSINRGLAKYNQFYNTFRPHQTLRQYTPVQYYLSKEAQKSHM